MPKTFTLIKRSLKDVWSSRQSLGPIILLIMVPVALFQVFTQSEGTLGVYASFATLIMNIAVIYTVIKIKADGKRVSLANAYYVGTSRFVPFVCVVGLLGMQLLPLLIGGLIYLSGSTGSTVGLGPVEMVLLGGVWLLFGLPTFRWLTRTVFAMYLVQDPSLSPVAAARASSALVRGKGWSVFGKILAGSVFAAIILIVPSLAISTLPETAGWLSKLATGLLQVVSAVVIVPFASMYGYNLLEALGGKPKTS